MFPSYYLLGRVAHADAARAALAIEHLRNVDDAIEPSRTGLPRLTTIEVTPDEVGPDGVRLDQASKTKLAAAGIDIEEVERQLHGMTRGDRKLLAEVVHGAERDAPRADIDEQLHWYGIAPTEEEEARIARGETVTFLVGDARSDGSVG